MRSPPTSWRVKKLPVKKSPVKKCPKFRDRDRFMPTFVCLRTCSDHRPELISLRANLFRPDSSTVRATIVSKPPTPRLSPPPKITPIYWRPYEMYISSSLQFSGTTNAPGEWQTMRVCRTTGTLVRLDTSNLHRVVLQLPKHINSLSNAPTYNPVRITMNDVVRNIVFAQEPTPSRHRSWLALCTRSEVTWLRIDLVAQRIDRAAMQLLDDFMYDPDTLATWRRLIPPHPGQAHLRPIALDHSFSAHIVASTKPVGSSPVIIQCFINHFDPYVLVRTMLAMRGQTEPMPFPRIHVIHLTSPRDRLVSFVWNSVSLDTVAARTMSGCVVVRGWASSDSSVAPLWTQRIECSSDPSTAVTHLSFESDSRLMMVTASGTVRMVRVGVHGLERLVCVVDRNREIMHDAMMFRVPSRREYVQQIITLSNHEWLFVYRTRIQHWCAASASSSCLQTIYIPNGLLHVSYIESYRFIVVLDSNGQIRSYYRDGAVSSWKPCSWRRRVGQAIPLRGPAMIECR